MDDQSLILPCLFLQLVLEYLDTRCATDVMSLGSSEVITLWIIDEVCGSDLEILIIQLIYKTSSFGILSHSMNEIFMENYLKHPPFVFQNIWYGFKVMFFSYNTHARPI